RGIASPDLARALDARPVRAASDRSRTALDAEARKSAVAILDGLAGFRLRGGRRGRRGIGRRRRSAGVGRSRRLRAGGEGEKGGQRERFHGSSYGRVEGRDQGAAHFLRKVKRMRSAVL